MDTSPTSMFNNYEQDFQQIITSIRSKLEETSETGGVGEPFSRDERGAFFLFGRGADI